MLTLSSLFILLSMNYKTTETNLPIIVCLGKLGIRRGEEAVRKRVY